VERGRFIRFECEGDGIVRETGHETVAAVAPPHPPVTDTQVEPGLNCVRKRVATGKDKPLVVLKVPRWVSVIEK